jgi:hypothetical protein
MTQTAAEQLAQIAQLAASIRAHIEKGDEANLTADLAMDEAEQHYKAAGLCLKELKKQKPRAVSWENFVKGYCGISRQWADVLIRIGEGKITLEEVRGCAAARVQRHRDRQALLRNSGSAAQEAAPAAAGSSDSQPTGSDVTPPKPSEADPVPPVVPPAPADERPPPAGAAPPKPREAGLLEQFAAAVMELKRLTSAKSAATFIRTSVSVDDLEMVSRTLAQIVQAIRNSEKEEKEAA